MGRFLIIIIIIIIIVGVRAQDRILGLGFCPRTLIGPKMSK